MPIVHRPSSIVHNSYSGSTHQVDNSITPSFLTLPEWKFEGELVSISFVFSIRLPVPRLNYYASSCLAITLPFPDPCLGLPVSLGKGWSQPFEFSCRTVLSYKSLQVPGNSSLETLIVAAIQYDNSGVYLTSSPHPFLCHSHFCL